MTGEVVVKFHARYRVVLMTLLSHSSVSLTLKAPRKMHLKMSSAEVVCCK